MFLDIRYLLNSGWTCSCVCWFGSISGLNLQTLCFQIGLCEDIRSWLTACMTERGSRIEYHRNYRTCYKPPTGTGFSTVIHTCIHDITLHYNILHYNTLHYSTIHYMTSQYITLHQITSHYITLHHITSHYITLHHITSHHYITYHTMSFIHTCIISAYKYIIYLFIYLFSYLYIYWGFP